LKPLKETRTRTERADKRNGARPYPRMLPQWALEISRPILSGSSRLLWGLRWLGTENIPSSGGLVIAANHQTYVDPVWISCPVKRPVRYLAWDAAFNWPMMGPIMRMLGAWPLQVEGSDPAAIRLSMQWLREGGVVVLFPEGGRGNPDGTLKRFKPGAVRIALETEVAILPVTIRGGHSVWPSSHRFPRLAPVEIVYHPLFMIEQRENEEPRECARRETERLTEIIRSAL